MKYLVVTHTNEDANTLTWVRQFNELHYDSDQEAVEQQIAFEFWGDPELITDIHVYDEEDVPDDEIIKYDVEFWNHETSSIDNQHVVCLEEFFSGEPVNLQEDVIYGRFEVFGDTVTCVKDSSGKVVYEAEVPTHALDDIL